jgi:hypothetical protein
VVLEHRLRSQLPQCFWEALAMGVCEALTMCDRPLPPEIPLITNGRQISKCDYEVRATRDRTFYHPPMNFTDIPP